ncbi:MAG: hypothetical protein KZQ58_04330 [gamma proteobacterium symbiont of Bathyaustriella thionipta]|nr:hypothetical protein [gamma proteobacterium symbiont of Bathyaustriella thionipta]
MDERTDEIEQTANAEEDTQGRLWPSLGYTQQVEALKEAIGSKVYLVELKPNAVHIGIHFSDTAYELLGVVDFPRPDPIKGIAPHLILLEDGRGVNLGSIPRITVQSPFNPPDAHILYQDNFLMQRLLFGERRLSKASIAATSHALLGRILGKAVGESIRGSRKAIPDPDASTRSTAVKKLRQKP